MAIDSGQMIKKLRKDMGLTQAELANRLLISQRHVARLESNETRLDVWQFISFMEMLGQRTEDFWLLYLDTEEYEQYLMFRRLKFILREKGREGDVKELLQKLALKEGGFTEKSFLKQFLLFTEIEIDRTMPPAGKLERYDKIIRMSIPDFDETQVSTYRLTHNERAILARMASTIYVLGDKDRAIALARSLVEFIDNSQMSFEEKGVTLTTHLINLATMLGKAGKHEECIACCDRLVQVSHEYYNYRHVPQALHNKANCLEELGHSKDEYVHLLLQAYLCADAMGNKPYAAALKNFFEKDNTFEGLDPKFLPR